jgi:Tol biopolymer transport system component
MTMTNRLPALLLTLTCSACAAAAAEAVRWTPPTLSTPAYEASPSFAHDGGTLYFLAADAAFRRYQIAQSRCVDGRWTKGEPAPFSMPLPVWDADPAVTPDGQRLYFVSTRQDPKAEDFDIWFVQRQANGSWGPAQRLPEPVNSKSSELLPRADAQGRLYFGSDRAGGQGQGDIYVAEQDAQGRWSVSNVGPPVSTAHFEYEAEISRDGRTMVVVANRGERSHLYRYALRDGKWVEVGQVAAKDDQFQVGPLLSPKADRLLFAQRDGADSGEIFLIDLIPDPDRSWPPSCP